MQNVFLLHNSKWYSPIWALLFALSLMLLWLNRDKWKKGYDAFFWLIILAVGIVYCPLLANILIPRFLPSFAEYERLSWIFFEIPLLSYMLVSLSKDFSKKQSGQLFIFACLVVLILIGSPDNRNFFQKPQNQYKISQEAIYYSDLINDYSPDGQVVVCVQVDSENDYKSGENLGGNLYYGIREYDPRLILRHMSVHPEQYMDSNFVFPERIPSYVDYYICPKSPVIYQELIRIGYKYFNESENYAIFSNVSNN